MPLIGLSVDWTWHRKELVNLKVGQEELPKPKYEEKERKNKMEQNIQQLQNNFKRNPTQINTKRGRKRMNQEKYLKQS